MPNPNDIIAALDHDHCACVGILHMLDQERWADAGRLLARVVREYRADHYQSLADELSALAELVAPQHIVFDFTVEPVDVELDRATRARDMTETGQ